MARKHKRSRPNNAGVEITVQAGQYTAVKFSVPTQMGSPLIRVYAQPHHDFLFEAFRGGMLFDCKRCQKRHILRWNTYFLKLQRDPSPTRNYHVLCTQVGDTWLVRTDERIPDHLKAHTIFTISDNMSDLLASIYAALITGNDEKNS